VPASVATDSTNVVRPIRYGARIRGAGHARTLAARAQSFRIAAYPGRRSAAMINDNLIRSLGDQLGRFIGDSAAREDMQKSLNTIVQGVFARLDLVTREQFDAQLETLERTREQLAMLEGELARLQEQLAELERASE
jgi:BMFP domain-containing protein YqiC